MRIDINVPVVDGRVVEDNLRLQVYSHVLELLSEYSGLVVMAHQGRPGGRGFIPLEQHSIALRKSLPSGTNIEFVPLKEVFSEQTLRRIRDLREGDILLLDNVRMLDEEYHFDPSSSAFVDHFKGSIKTCVNDAISVWHRPHSSLMCLPYIATTYIGLRSTHELRALSDILNEKGEDCGIVIGGSKLGKASYLAKILKRMEAFTGGLPGQLIARAKGFDLGKNNNNLLKMRLRSDHFELARILVKRFDVHHPIDFCVVEDGERRTVPLEQMKRSEGLIMDIGEETIKEYASKLQEKTIKIRVGPLGVYERGFDGGARLTKMIAGSGLIFVGGDTSQELIRYDLDGKISSMGGLILLGGGSFIHGLAGELYPSVDLILKQ